MAGPWYAYNLMWNEATRWNGDKPMGTGVTITYSFAQVQSKLSNHQAFEPMDANEIAATRKALAYISSIANITFVEKTGSQGEMEFGMADLRPEGAGGIAHSQMDAGGIFKAAVLLNSQEPTLKVSTYKPGFNTSADFTGNGWQTILHEIGHALGLKHPFNTNTAGDPNSVMPKGWDYHSYSIMSYTSMPYTDVVLIKDAADGSQYSKYGALKPMGMSLFDIGTLQYMYGAPKTTANATYTFAPTKPVLQTIYDKGAQSTVNFSAFKTGVTVNMNGGEINNLPIKQELPAWAVPAQPYNGAAALVFADGSLVARAIGGSGNDTFIGNAAANYLDGGLGSDTLKGGAGSDTYVINSLTDIVDETGGSGADTVRASVSVDLTVATRFKGAVEHVTLLGTGSLSASGNAYANTLRGNAGSNTLDGRGGADTLIGGAGNDTYKVDNAKDRIVEAAGTAGGTDTVQASVSYALATGVAVEKLQTANIKATTAINLTGNEFAQAITGNAGANILNGKGGNDTLTGSGGNDTFVFNTALKTAGVDVITDFGNVSGNNDVFKLDNAVFTALGAATGVLAAGAFMANLTGLATQSDDRIVYETDTGKLFYDADGVGGTAGVHFATISNFASLKGAAALAAADFMVV